MSTRRRALIVCAIALIAASVALLLRDREAPAGALDAATLVPGQQAQAARGPLPVAAPLTPARPPAVAPPVFDLVSVEKDEVCEGEENLVAVHAHTTDGNDAFLHYTVAGEAGGQVPAPHPQRRFRDAAARHGDAVHPADAAVPGDGS